MPCLPYPAPRPYAPHRSYAPYLHGCLDMCRFSESLNTVKDVAEKSISEDYDSLIQDTAKSVKADMSSDFSNYGHHMWDLK